MNDITVTPNYSLAGSMYFTPVIDLLLRLRFAGFTPEVIELANKVNPNFTLSGHPSEFAAVACGIAESPRSTLHVRYKGEIALIIFRTKCMPSDVVLYYDKSILDLRHIIEKHSDDWDTPPTYKLPTE